MNTFQGSSKLFTLVENSREICRGGKLARGQTQVPFEISLDSDNPEQPKLYETYQGVFISIQYGIKACLKRPFFYKDLVETKEIFVEYDSSPIGAPQLIRQPIRFVITPDSLTATRYDIIPSFKITGQIDSSANLLTEPITGEFVIEKCDATIRSVELQLVRVETCGNLLPSGHMNARNVCRDATEVQNIQIGDGNLLRNIPIDIYMVLPRFFTCPTVITNHFRIEFEINLVIIFDDNHLLTENFPIKLMRSTLQPIDMGP